jgi:LPS-assembly protein
MMNWCKNTKKYLLTLIVVIFYLFVNAMVNKKEGNFFANTASFNTTDSVPKKKNGLATPTQREVEQYDSIQKLQKKDSPVIPVATIDTFNVNFSKDSLDAPVKREAIDSAVFLVDEKKFILYGKAKTTYSDNNIDAGYIELDNKENLVRARGFIDSTGKISEQMVMKTGEQIIAADSITYSTKTKKGLSHNTRTQSNEMFVQSKKTKTIGDGKSFFGYDNKFTTCNLDEPHFCFHTKKIKVINNELAVSNFANPEFEGVPLPIGIPFGIYPMKTGRHSGFLPPQFTANEDLGIGLEGLGYYKVISDYWDVMLRTNIYSYGSWNAIISPSYRKRYRYNGSFNINIQNTKLNFKGDADFTKNRSFNIGWSHTADTRARPGISFSANVNAGKSSFNNFNPNNNFRNTQNQLYSSITWSKTWQDKRKPFNLTISANHNQNTNSNLVNLNLPEIAFSVQTIYPFLRKDGVGEQKWYEKIGIAYTGNLKSQMAFRDNVALKEILRTIKDTFQWGANHNIPIILSLPALGPLQIAPGISYEERTYGQKILREWNPTTKKVDTTIKKGIFEARQMSFSLSLATALYGTFQFKNRTHGVTAIRHVIRPNISIQYSPNMNGKYYQQLKIDTSGRTASVTVFDGNIYSPFGNNKFGGLGFGIDNNIELKARKRGDTTKEGERKIRIIDGFSITSAYNFLIDTLKLSPFNMSMRSTLADGKVSITAGATLDPYKTNEKGDKINQYVWNGQKFGIGTFGRFVGANLALSTQFKGGEKKDNKNKTPEEIRKGKDYTNKATTDMSMDEQMRMSDYINNHPAEFVDFSIPWDISLAFAMNLDRQLQPDYSYKTQFNANVNFNGNFALTPKWKLGANGYYDFRSGRVQQMQMFITREMHCWQLAINVTPISSGGFRSFNITLNPKAGILRDLRVNRTRYFYGD